MLAGWRTSRHAKQMGSSQSSGNWELIGIFLASASGNGCIQYSPLLHVLLAGQLKVFR